MTPLEQRGGEQMTGITDGTSIHSGPAPVRSRPPILGIILVIGVLVGGGFLVRETRSSTTSKVPGVEQRGVASLDANATEAKRLAIVRGKETSWLPAVRIEGTLAAHQSSEVAFRLPGKLHRVHVKLGDQVRSGQLLGTLDAVQATAQMEAGDAHVRARKAQLTLAEDAQRRMSSLVDDGAMADTVAVKNEQERALAAAQLDAAHAELRLADIALRNHEVFAPFAGTVTRVPSGIGSVVGPQQPSFEIVDTSKLNLTTSVSEQDASLFASGAEVEIEGYGAPIRGKVDVVLPTLDPRTRRVRVQASLNGQAALRVGSLVRGWIRSKGELSVVRLPAEVLMPGSSDEVFVANTATSRVERRRLTLTKDEDGGLLVRAGLDASEDVLLSPPRELVTSETYAFETQVTQ